MNWLRGWFLRNTPTLPSFKKHFSLRSSEILAPLQGTDGGSLVSGGLRCAATTGYYLAAFQAETLLRPSCVWRADPHQVPAYGSESSSRRKVITSQHSYPCWSSPFILRRSYLATRFSAIVFTDFFTISFNTFRSTSASFFIYRHDLAVLCFPRRFIRSGKSSKPPMM